jgi:hypothetical protein
MDFNTDYKTFEDLGAEAKIALLFLEEETQQLKKQIGSFSKDVNSFMSIYETQRQWDARKVAK